MTIARGGNGDARIARHPARPAAGDVQPRSEGLFPPRWRKLPEEGHRGRGPRGYARSDQRIRDELCEQLTDDGWVDATDIEVKVEGGVVTLEGQVPASSHKWRAEDLAEAVPGATAVVNRLRVRRR